MAQPLSTYSDLQQSGVLSTESTVLQYCIDVGIIRPHQYCNDCSTYMNLKPCSTSMFTDGYYWTCPTSTKVPPQLVDH